MTSLRSSGQNVSSSGGAFRFPLALLLAALAGAGTTHLLLPATPSPAAEAVPTASPEAPEEAVVEVDVRRPQLQPGSTPAGPAEAELQALRDEVATSELRLALLKGQWESLVGVEQPWTDRVRPEDRPEAVETMIEEALQTYEEAELTVLDCDEYPCIVGIDMPMRVEDGSINIYMTRDLPPGWMSDRAGRTSGLAFHPDGERGTFFFAFYDHLTDDPEGLDLRVKVRRERQEALRRHAWSQEGDEE